LKKEVNLVTFRGSAIRVGIVITGSSYRGGSWLIVERGGGDINIPPMFAEKPKSEMDLLDDDTHKAGHG